MTSFSQRKGLKPVRSVLQVDSMDADLRNSLWNVLCLHYWDYMKKAYLREDKELHILFTRLWIHYFKWPKDSMKGGWSGARGVIRQYFFDCKWHEVYDFVEFVANNYPEPYNKDGWNEKFMNACDDFLKQEMSAYRFVGGQIAQLTSEEEIAEIEEALKIGGSLKPVNEHLESALAHFSDRTSPDYRNSIKESISAVEAICRMITGDCKATLGQAIKRVGDKLELHRALEDAFDKLYGYTCDKDGIRHAMMDQPSLDAEDAKFMLVSCSAFVNYLIAKSSKAGIKL